jgi:homocysteine S-methyltransferase
MVAAGVRIVGGCCGTTPETIAQTAKALASDGRAAPRLSFPTPERVRVPAASLSRPTHLQEILGRSFAVTVEIDPPNGFDVGSLLPKIRSLRDSGYVDAIDVADSPRARARMSAFALAALIQGELGMETVLHMACRHRNLVAVHSDLLGAHALGVRNIFVVMGDLPALGDYPDATVVNDITATGLMSLLTQFNRGADLTGRPLEHATAFHVGCAFNFCAKDLGRELALLERKVDAGAHFALSQPVFDVATIRRVIEKLGGRFPLPLLAGTLPLWNARHALFLHNEVPGIVVPDPVLRRMEAAGDDGRSVGVAIAQETLNGLAGLVQGAYFMPPFGRYELVTEVMAGVDRGEPVPAGAAPSW